MTLPLILEQKLDSLIRLAKSADKLYTMIYQSELAGDSVEFQKNIIYLEMVLDTELENYQKLSFEEQNEIKTYIIQNGLASSGFLLTNLDEMITYNDDEKIYNRIMNKFEQNSTTDLDEEITKNNLQLSTSDLYLLRNNALFIDQVMSQSMYETVNGILALIQERKQENAPFYLKLKYALAFLDEQIENKLVDNRFNLNAVLKEEQINSWDFFDPSYRDSFLYSMTLAQVDDLMQLGDLSFYNNELSDKLNYHFAMMTVTLGLSSVDQVLAFQRFVAEEMIDVSNPIMQEKIQNIIDNILLNKKQSFTRNQSKNN